ncbi:hypothetical protein GRJ2_003298400 [Grus japonensis]|uniref:Uncharacterized protein n=1 Tax=Grus japonensis TaxID=30415 RepID=A0ABC9YHF2_GRUJA
MRKRHPFSEDVICRPGKWTTMERGIQYLRELAVREMVYYDPDNVQLPTDPDEVQCTRPMWQKFVRSAPSSYANSLAVIDWKSEEAPTVDEVAGQLRQYEESLSSSLVSAVEKLSQKLQQLEENLSYSLSYLYKPIDPIWPVRKSNGEWRLTVDYRGLNEVTPPMSAAVPDMLELQYELESKAAKWQDQRLKMCTTLQPERMALPGFSGRKHQGRHEVNPYGLDSGYRGSEARYTPTEKEILAAYERVRVASEVVGTEAQLLLAPRLPVLGWMFTGKVPSTHHATDAMWSKWVALITQRARIGNPNRPGILEVIMDWSEGKDFAILPEEEVMCAEEAPPYNKLTEDEKQYALFTDGSHHIVGKHRRWKAST